MYLGIKVKNLSKQMGWTQSELADKAGVSTAAISQIEGKNRNPTFFVMTNIARALGVSIEVFIDEKDLPENSRDIFYLFYQKFWHIEKLSEYDQELILAIIERLKDV